jgi:Undecaprenyl-phosphate galactose phosphotransferase WbaP
MFNPDLNLRMYLTIFPTILLFFPVFLFQSLYPGLLLHPAEEMQRIFHSVTAVILVLASTIFLRKSGDDYSRYVVLIGWMLAVPTILLGRFCTRKLFSQASWWSVPGVILGSSGSVREMARGFKNAQLGLRIKGVLLDGPVGQWDSDLPPIIGHLYDAPLLRGIARYAIVIMPDRSHTEIRKIIQDHCRNFHRVLIVTEIPGICSLGATVREVGGQVGLEVPQRLCHTTPKIIKRCLDIVVSGALLLLLAPVFLIVAIAIKLDSKGAVVFGHCRYGKEGAPFQALKFRTMVTDADRILKNYLRRHPELMLEWERDHKLKDDPRITRVGRWLRRYSLDELPQLVNILIGHMSLVGPRPIVKSEIGRYAGSYDLYTRVPPGLTGLWQVSGRNNTTYDQRVAFDEYYIRNWSIWMDLYILARTFQAVLLAEGAY